MDARDRKKAASEWNRILKEHPSFARVVLAQQVILMEASDLGFRLIDLHMCRLIERGIIFPFIDFWIERCKNKPHLEIGGLIGCLSTTKNPEDCFNIRQEIDWFEDPFAHDPVSPSKPPIPPLRG